MKEIKILSNKYANFSLILALGLFLGWLLFHMVPERPVTIHQHEANETIWTCSMHPQIRLTQPGKCPICAMDLIPLVQEGLPATDPEALRMTAGAVQLANVETSKVSAKTPVKDIRLYGKVDTDERLLQNQVAHIQGRIENLNVNFTGETVSPGQILGQIYSPELVTVQQELLEAARTKDQQPGIYEAVKEKLRQWKLTDNQIYDLERSPDAQGRINIVSDTKGIIISRRVNKGDYVSQGTVLFEIADLSRVWVMFDAYESDLPFLKEDGMISFNIPAIPGEKFSGKIVFIDPSVDPVTRISKVRVEAGNSSGKLKPGMYATGYATAVIEDQGSRLTIPESAVLWTGKRSVVYVKLEDSSDPVFKMREVELGPHVANGYIVLDGLAEGEVIVTRGAFSVDAASQLEGKPSMMNNQNRQTDMAKGTFKVSGSCEMCKDRIESTARKVRGVNAATWDINTKTLMLEFDKRIASSDMVLKAIADAGHDNEKYRAEDDVYEKLPECCLYRN